MKQRRHLKHQLGYALAIGAKHRRIVFAHHMQYHIVIGLVGVVPMTMPVGGTHVHLHIAHPQVTINLNFCVKKIGTCIGVKQALINDTHLAPIIGQHVFA